MEKEISAGLTVEEKTPRREKKGCTILSRRLGVKRRRVFIGSLQWWIEGLQSSSVYRRLLCLHAE